SFENKDQIAFEPAQERALRENAAAWDFFQAQPPWYRRTITWWVTSAKKPETKEKRLATLIAECAAGRTLRQLSRKPKDAT
ncbi:MAG TPA: YdeI/OmpD-associated family protein, partial [Longimicrobiaceae bacterium]|nr:YdeI/OmpD-associated family protein [Longimicrobiaceae bacterium]